MNILIVCHGNINRSACAEILLKKIKPNWNIRSAALKETKGGELMAKKMRQVLLEYGYDENDTNFRSTPINKEMVTWANEILYMDGNNKKRLVEKYGAIVLKKSVNLGNIISLQKIEDPHFCKGIEKHKIVYNQIERALIKYASTKK